MTTIICTVTPAEMHVEETNSSLGFASRAKKISNSVKVNEVDINHYHETKQRLNIQ
jgi:centromeric protein E